MPRIPFRLALAAAAFTATAGAKVEPGEILIGEMSCVACHEAPAGVKERLDSRRPPKLGGDGLRLTPQWLRAFLADPQAEAPGSLMPDMLHALVPEQKAEAVEALTHFLVSLRPEDEPSQTGASSAAIKTGEELYHSVGCAMCHAPFKLPSEKANDAAAKEELSRLAQTSVPLGNLAKKYSVRELTAFLRDPMRARPSGRMPSLKLNDGEARAIAMYLLRAQVPAGEKTWLAGVAYDYYAKQLPELPQFDRLQPDASGTVENFTLAVAKRKNDFALRFYGLLTAPEEGDYKFYTASDDGSRLYIDEKLIVDNGGVHPAQERSAPVKLTAGEHTIRLEYFDGGGNAELKVQWKQPGGQREEIPENLLTHEGQSLRPLGSDAAFVVDGNKAALGRVLFAEFNCAACHQLESPGVKARPLAELYDQPAGCLAANPKPGVPKFKLNDGQRAALLAQLGAQESLGSPLGAGDQIKRRMTVLNCFACHQREQRGGADGLRRDYFASVGEVDLGDEGRVPPHLNEVGAKLQREWIEAVLLRGAAVRPYMATRMPLFGADNVAKLAELFEKADTPPNAAAQPAASPATSDTEKFGRKLVGVGGLTCIACHNFAGNKSLGVPALDLASTGQRLKRDWFRRYLLDPQALRPGTRMPPFWPNGVAVNRDILGGDSEKQIAALWAWLSRKTFTDLPSGLTKGKAELIADTEAVMYRNFIEGAGPRAIGVGYPEKANLAFDANEMRLALLWQGPFIDAARHRTGRGEGFEKPLGVNVVKGPTGPPFAVLESESAPWPSAIGKAGGYQFQGYRLDEKRRPAFRYRFNDLEIEDYPVAISGAVDSAFKRIINVTATNPISRLYFRAAVAEKIEAKDGAFLAGKMKLTFPGAKPLIRASEGKSELLVPLNFNGATATIIEEIEW